MPKVPKQDYGQGSIFKDRRRGTWRGQIVIDGRRRSVTASSPREVRAKLDALRDGDGGDGDSISVGAWLEDWVSALSDEVSGNTTASRRWAIGALEPLHKRTLTALRTEHIEATLKAAMDRGLGYASLERVRCVLGMALDEAMRRRHLDYNPARLARIPRGAVRGKKRRVLTDRKCDV